MCAGGEIKVEGPETIIAAAPSKGAGVEGKVEGPEAIITGVLPSGSDGVESKLEVPEAKITESDSKHEGPVIGEVPTESDGDEGKVEGPEITSKEVSGWDSEFREYLKELHAYVLNYVPKWCLGNEVLKQVLLFGAGCAGDALVGYALGLLLPAWILRKVWFVYQAKSVLKNPGKLMKAPGKGGAYILREVFESDPKAYFRALRGKGL